VRPVDPEAYDAYLRGMQLWCRVTPADLDSAQWYFDLALQKDPKYAAAHAGIALVWIGRQQLGMTPPSEAAPKAREAAQRAIMLDDSIAETHYVLALLKAWTDWDWAGAESEFRRTIEINPGFPDVRIYYAHLLAILGRMPEAIEQGERAVRLDPYNALFHGLFGIVLTMAGRSDEALAQARLGQKMNPNEIFSAQVLWIEYEKEKMDREAAALVRLLFQNSYNFDMAEALDQGLASGGFREAMRRGADALEAFAQKNFVLPFDLAQLCVYAGDNGRTLTWLEKGYEIHDPGMPYLGQWPMLDPLRSEPRFQALLKKMNLPGPYPT
jgi:tetratricopeptide (TPR) repeat protein